MIKLPDYTDVLSAQKRINPFIHHTPVLHSESINKITGASIYFKCENLQKVGAFKFRGATNAILHLSEQEKLKGVATHSSGNHAAALALAARNQHIKVYVVMPENAPEIKKKAVKSYGAEITFCEATLKAREQSLNEVIKQTGAVFIHSYNNLHIIAGQGTAAIELLNEINDLDIVMTPIGGGGLISGTAIAAKGFNPNIKVYGAEPKLADDAYRSFKENRLIPLLKTDTIADGLRTSLGTINFQLITKYLDDIITVSEESIIEAMRMVWERMKIIIEPSSAVPLAAVLEQTTMFKNKKLGIILSGGNVDLTNLPF